MPTQTEARTVAGRATQYGHHVRNATEAYAFCPSCREQVTAYKMAWDRSFTLVMWTRAFYDHLQDCPGGEGSPR